MLLLNARISNSLALTKAVISSSPALLIALSGVSVVIERACLSLLRFIALGSAGRDVSVGAFRFFDPAGAAIVGKCSLCGTLWRSL